MTSILNFIGGEFTAAHSGLTLDNVNPATGEVYSTVPDSDGKDIDMAVRQAQNAFPHWAATPARNRAHLLRKLAVAIGENLDSLAQAESIDNGKPLALAKSVDIPRSAQNFEFFAEAIGQLHGDCFDMDGHALNYTTYSPLGVVACISPWNLPLYLLTWKIAPALAAGNTVVAKPSEVTPMTAYLLSQLCHEVGLPPGVLNIVHGSGAKIGDRLNTHPQIQAISFTGSTATGKIIAQQAAPLFKKLALEMGGKNPNIIFADCDFERAVDTTLRAAFANQGQICLCGSRIFVEKPIYQKFRDTLVEKILQLKVGNPLDARTDQGALVSQSHYEKVLQAIELARQEGGRILTGGQSVQPSDENKNGYFVAPTLIENLDFQCRTNQEEIFGPVATIQPFDGEDEVVKWANGTSYGLAGSIWTSDIKRAHHLARRIQSGIVWINTWMLRDLRTPFGGIKNSGLGREGGREALQFFSEVKNVCVETN